MKSWRTFDAPPSALAARRNALAILGSSLNPMKSVFVVPLLRRFNFMPYVYGKV